MIFQCTQWNLFDFNIKSTKFWPMMLAGILAKADPEPQSDVLHVHLLATQESGCIVSYIILILLE